MPNNAIHEDGQGVVEKPDESTNVEEQTVEGADTENPGKTYAASHYLLFGEATTDRYDSFFDCDGTREYLDSAGVPTDGQLTQARTKNTTAARYAGFHDAAERYCDFCGKELTGAEYESLKDGRDRCAECSSTVVRGLENFEVLFHQVCDGMTEKYSIDLPQNMTVEVVSAKKLARACGKDFTPTKYFDARTIGLAINRRGKYGVMFENGSPKVCLTATCAHELTHIWQYTHWNDATIQKNYGSHSLAIYEGMAKWAQIQYLYLINEAAQAERTLINEVMRTDVYGYGLRLFLNEYPLSQGIMLEGDTPFNHGEEPI